MILNLTMLMLKNTDNIDALCVLPARELQVLLWLVLTKGRYPGEQRAALDAGFGQDEQEGATQGQVSEQELQVPKDAVRDRLHEK